MEYPEMELELDTEILGTINEDQAKILTSEAIEFASSLHKKFNSTRLNLLVNFMHLQIQFLYFLNLIWQC